MQIRTNYKVKVLSYGMLARITHIYKNVTSIRAFMMSTVARTEAKSEYYSGPLEGTAPYHRCYILLHARDRPSNFPTVYQTAVSRELLIRGVRWGGGVSVNFSWMEHFSHQNSSRKSPATVFSRLGGRLDIPDVTLENLDEVESQILKHLEGPPAELTSKNVDVYVCTHAARDCRCGERGLQVYETLVRIVEEERIWNPSSLAHRIRIGAVGHVGGHQYAANVLIFPHGEM